MKTLLSLFQPARRPANCEAHSTSRGCPWLLGVQCWILNVSVLLLLLPASALAQGGVGDIVYTVGTTTTDSHGRAWAYILWQATDPALTSNRVYAVYSKPGNPTNPAPYMRLSVVKVQTDARIIEPHLQRAANLGDNLPKLQEDLSQLFGSFIPSGAISRAEAQQFMPRLLQHFDRIDANRDGQITREEIEAVRKVREERRQRRRAGKPKIGRAHV